MLDLMFVPVCQILRHIISLFRVHCPLHCNDVTALKMVSLLTWMVSFVTEDIVHVTAVHIVPTPTSVSAFMRFFYPFESTSTSVQFSFEVQMILTCLWCNAES